MGCRESIDIETREKKYFQEAAEFEKRHKESWEASERILSPKKTIPTKDFDLSPINGANVLRDRTHYTKPRF